MFIFDFLYWLAREHFIIFCILFFWTYIGCVKFTLWLLSKI